MNFTSISRLVSSVLIFLSWFCSIGQTTYTWRGPGGFGGSGDFQTPSHWNPTRNTPASDDILVLESSGFVTASNVPTQTVGKIILLSTSSSGGFEFQGQTGSTPTFTVGEIVMQKEIAFRANTVPFNVVIGNLSTTGTVRLSNNSTTNITFTGNVLDNGIDFNGSWSNANRTFASTSTYAYNQASGVGATFSTWQTGSTYSVTGIVSDGFPQPYSDNGYTPFSNFVWDCPNQTADANMTTYNNGGLTVLGTFLVKNTGTARLRYNMGGNVFANDYLQTGGTNYIQNRTLTIYRNFEQLGGTLQTDGSASILMDNTTSSRLAIVNSSGASVTVNNTGSVGDNNITLTGNLNTINNIFHNSGNLYMNGYTIFARGTNVNLGRGGLVYAGSTSGFDYRQDQTQTVNTLPGFIGGLNSLVLSVPANCNNNKLTMTEDLTITGILSIVGFAGCGQNSELDLNGKSLFLTGSVYIGGTSGRIRRNGGNITFAGGSFYFHQRNGGEIPFSTWQDLSTVSITGIVGDFVTNNNNTSYYDVIWDNANQTTNCCGFYDGTGTLSIRNNLVVKNSGTQYMLFNNANTGTVNVKNVSILGGALRIANSNTPFVISGDLFTYNSTVTSLQQQSATISFTGLSSFINLGSNWSASDNYRIILSKNSNADIITLQNNLTIPVIPYLNTGTIDLNGYSLRFTMPQFSINSVNHTAKITSNNALSNLSIIGGDMTDPGNGTLPGINGIFNNLYITNPSNDNYFYYGNTTILGSLGTGGANATTFTIPTGNTLYFDNIQRKSFFTNNIAANTSSIIFGSNGVYVHDINAGSIIPATWNSGSTCSITGFTSSTPLNINQNFYNFYWDCLGPASSVPRFFSGGNMTVNGTFAVLNNGGQNLELNGNTSTNNFSFNNVVLAFGNQFISGTSGSSTNVDIKGNFYQAPNNTVNTNNLNNHNITFSGNNSLLSAPGVWLSTNASSKIIINKSIGHGITLLSNINIPHEINQINGEVHLNGFLFKNDAQTIANTNPVFNTNNNPNSSLSLRLASSTARSLTINGTQMNSLTIVGGSTPNNSITGIFTILGTFELSQGSFWNLHILNSNSVYVANILRNSGCNSFSTSNSNNLIFGPNSTYIHAVDGKSFPRPCTWMAGSTVSVTGIVGNNNISNIHPQIYHNFIWDCPSQTINSSATGIVGTSSSNLTFTGLFHVKSTGLGAFNICSATNVNPNIVFTDFQQTGGTFYIFRPTVSAGSTSNNLILGGFSLLGGNFIKTIGTNSTTANITFGGSNTNLLINNNSFVGINNFTINKNSLSNSLTLLNSVTIPSSLTFIQGIITTGNNVLSVAGNILSASGVNGWVNGNLARTVSTPATTIEFPVGTSTVYNRTRITFQTITNSGDIVVGVQDGLHPDFSASCTSPSGYLNKTWTISTINGVSISPLNYSVIFTNAEIDRVGGSFITTLTSFNAQIYNNGIWHPHTSISGRTFTNTNLSNVTLLGSFNLGLNKSLNVSISGVPQVCTSALTALTVGGITGGSSPSYQWRVNGLDVATATSAVFASTFNNNDVVDLIFNANNAGCSNNPTTTTGLSITGYSTGFWLGTNSSSISDAANWCGGNVPNATDATIPQVLPASGLFAPVISSDITVNNLYILSGAVLSSTGTNNTLQINGSLSNLGTLALNNNSLSFGVGSTSSIVGNGFRMVDMTLRNGSNVSNFVNLSISGTLTLGSANATLNNTSGNEIKLLSFATNPSSVVGTARIAAIPNGSTILGTVTQQRYFPGKNAYRYISSPIKDATLQTIRNNTFVFNFASNTINGFDLATNNFPTIYWYVETAPGMQDVGWRYYRSVTGILEVGRGYYSLILGDRTQESSLGSTSSRVASTPVTLEFRGQPNIGTINLPVTYTASVATADGWNLVGNPYPSQIDWNSGTGWSKNDLEPNIWIYDPETSNTNVTTGTGSFFTYNANTGISTPSRPNPNIIASTQGFFVRATAAGVSLTINENAKIADNHFGYFRNEAQADNIRIELLRTTGEKDETVVAIRSNAVNEFNSFHDASKMMNAGISVYSFTKDGKSVAINAINGDTSFNQIPLAFSAQPGSYKLKVYSTAANRKVSVLDKVTGNISEINGEDELSFTTATASATNRFVLLIDNKAVAVEENQNTIAGIAAVNSIVGTDIISQQETENNITSTKAKVNTSVDAYPNPTEGNDLKLQLLSAKNESIAISVFDIQGTFVKKYSFAVTEGENLFVIPSSDFGSGSYILQLSGSDWSKVVKLVKQ